MGLKYFINSKCFVILKRFPELKIVECIVTDYVGKYGVKTFVKPINNSKSKIYCVNQQLDCFDTIEEARTSFKMELKK
jgi:hypothetical protein